jgi:hypothetical protein
MLLVCFRRGGGKGEVVAGGGGVVWVGRFGFGFGGVEGVLSGCVGGCSDVGGCDVDVDGGDIGGDEVEPGIAGACGNVFVVGCGDVWVCG